MMSEIIEQITREIASQYDDMIEKALKQCGFTMRIYNAILYRTSERIFVD